MNQSKYCFEISHQSVISTSLIRLRLWGALSFPLGYLLKLLPCLMFFNSQRAKMCYLHSVTSTWLPQNPFFNPQLYECPSFRWYFIILFTSHCFGPCGSLQGRERRGVRETQKERKKETEARSEGWKGGERRKKEREGEGEREHSRVSFFYKHMNSTKIDAYI